MNTTKTVAATGLPIARKDHAEVMVRFARATMAKCRHLLVSLETKLGPGTAELGMRTGIHSGPVTAGILRGGIVEPSLLRSQSCFMSVPPFSSTLFTFANDADKSRFQVSQDLGLP